MGGIGTKMGLEKGLKSVCQETHHVIPFTCKLWYDKDADFWIPGLATFEIEECTAITVVDIAKVDVLGCNAHKDCDSKQFCSYCVRGKSGTGSECHSAINNGFSGHCEN